MFIESNLEVILSYLNKLTPESKALWGSMSPQRMVEHLTDTLRIATGENPQAMLVEEEKLPRMLAFLASDKEMAQNIEVPFAGKDVPLRNEELELAVDEFIDTWLHFEDVYEKNPDLTEIHSFYGPLNYELWLRLNSKHLTHHFTQFGLID